MQSFNLFYSLTIQQSVQLLCSGLQAFQHKPLLRDNGKGYPHAEEIRPQLLQQRNLPADTAPAGPRGQQAALPRGSGERCGQPEHYHGAGEPPQGLREQSATNSW